MKQAESAVQIERLRFAMLNLLRLRELAKRHQPGRGCPAEKTASRGPPRFGAVALYRTGGDHLRGLCSDSDLSVLLAQSVRMGWDHPDKQFIGLANYEQLFQDEQFWTSLRNNVYWLVLFLLGPVGGVAIAIFLNQVPGMRLVKSLFFFPFVLSQVVIGLVFSGFTIRRTAF